MAEKTNPTKVSDADPKKAWAKPSIEKIIDVKRTAGGTGTFNTPGDNAGYRS